ncbi:ATP-binding cassette domain-containing protein [Sulfitobacter sp. D35]|uniref:thiamine ABC transporter ATP-binding protein n=1 Tax=Sulfitobacter sp. D35 TaxID=3083252 RepID=UPI00296FDCB3|nr:ATP-binding cassette domain-containing protein [Sulfitobacter sp. D35]MDW4498234.1 ATP-binding cassette domain-containing protein [Sulfitobacter sp. D35]
MLQIEDMRVRLGSFELAADFSIAEGRRVAVIGPSGSGKSTLLSSIAGFVAPVRGEILWKGDEITRERPGDRPVSMLFQDNNLFPHLSVMQNVGLGLRPDLKLEAAQKAQVVDALRRVELQDHAGKKPAALSGGQQSRAALARVLVQDRPLVLLDEPFAALGPALRRDMLELVRELVAETGATLMMITHAPEDVGRIADDVIFVDAGRAQAPMPAADLLENPPPALRAYLG